MTESDIPTPPHLFCDAGPIQPEALCEKLVSPGPRRAADSMALLKCCQVFAANFRTSQERLRVVA
jgi:hypothetical protein